MLRERERYIMYMYIDCIVHTVGCERQRSLRHAADACVASTLK